MSQLITAVHSVEITETVPYNVGLVVAQLLSSFFEWSCQCTSAF